MVIAIVVILVILLIMWIGAKVLSLSFGCLGVAIKWILKVVVVILIIAALASIC